eukprot:gene18301-biopygen20436
MSALPKPSIPVLHPNRAADVWYVSCALLHLPFGHQVVALLHQAEGTKLSHCCTSLWPSFCCSDAATARARARARARGGAMLVGSDCKRDPSRSAVLPSGIRTCQPGKCFVKHRILESNTPGSQDTGACMARAWRGLWATFDLGLRGHGAGVARACPVTPRDPYSEEHLTVKKHKKEHLRRAGGGGGGACGRAGRGAPALSFSAKKAAHGSGCTTSMTNAAKHDENPCFYVRNSAPGLWQMRAKAIWKHQQQSIAGQPVLCPTDKVQWNAFLFVQTRGLDARGRVGSQGSLAGVPLGSLGSLPWGWMGSLGCLPGCPFCPRAGCPGAGWAPWAACPDARFAPGQDALGQDGQGGLDALGQDGLPGLPARAKWAPWAPCPGARGHPGLDAATLKRYRGDFYAGGPSQLPAEVPNMRHGPRPGTPQMPQMLEHCTPAWVSVGVHGQPWAPEGMSSGHPASADKPSDVCFAQPCEEGHATRRTNDTCFLWAPCGPKQG